MRILVEHAHRRNLDAHSRNIPQTHPSLNRMNNRQHLAITRHQDCMGESAQMGTEGSHRRPQGNIQEGRSMRFVQRIVRDSSLRQRSTDKTRGGNGGARWRDRGGVTRNKWLVPGRTVHASVETSMETS